MSFEKKYVQFSIMMIISIENDFPSPKELAEEDHIYQWIIFKFPSKKQSIIIASRTNNERSSDFCII